MRPRGPAPPRLAASPRGLLTLSVPQFPRLQSGDSNNTRLAGSPWGPDEAVFSAWDAAGIETRRRPSGPRALDAAARSCSSSALLGRSPRPARPGRAAAPHPGRPRAPFSAVHVGPTVPRQPCGAFVAFVAAVEVEPVHRAGARGRGVRSLPSAVRPGPAAVVDVSAPPSPRSPTCALGNH